jgi:hypothetical protein
MRSPLIAAAILISFALPLAAHADITYSVTIGGSTVSGILPPTPIYFNDVFPFYNSTYHTTGSNGDDLYLIFYGQAQDDALSTSGFGHLDLEYTDYTAGFDYLLDGPSIVSSPFSDPIFSPGTYNLTPDPEGTGGPDVTLIIGASGATPEPSSLVLLGTGILSIAGAARRRFRKA